MPRREEPTFRLKEIIWDIAATIGRDNIPAILRDLDYKLEQLRKDKENDFCEDTPSERKIKQIVEGINKVPPEAVISKLPSYVWRLRNDYETLKQLAEESSQTSQVTTGYRLIETTQEDTYDIEIPFFISMELRHYLKQQLVRHFDDLAEAAQILANNMQMLKGFGEFLESETPFDASDVVIDGNIIDGGKVGIVNGKGTVHVWDGYIKADGTMDIQPTDSLLAKCLLEHFNYRFPETAYYKDWHEVDSRNIKIEIVDKLRLLATSRNFGFCPSCSVCKDLSI